jgi:predicted Zn finger-like uncharacterized protein
MIITCICGAKLKIDDNKLTGSGVRIKCPKCGTAHLAKRSAPSAVVPSFEPAMPWFAPASSVAPQAPAAPTVSQQRSFAHSSSLVLVAHDSKVVADMIRGVVGETGLTVVHATDGLDALKKATALKPKVMIVDVGLTGIYGFELCERLKGDPDTRSIKIILLSSVYGLTAYKRNPITLYGADDYIEKHHIPDRLVPKLKQLLLDQTSDTPTRPQPVADVPKEHVLPSHSASAPTSKQSHVQPSPAAEPLKRVPDARPSIPEVHDAIPTIPGAFDAARKRVADPLIPTPAAATVSPRPVVGRPVMKDESVKLDTSFFEQDEYEAPAGPSANTAVDPEEVEKARRFARLIVSDIVLYNQETVAEGIAKGTFHDLLREDITEGKALYEKRVPEAIRATKDYYQEAFDNFIATKKKQR